jgi:Domain of unknown function (DUF4290)
MMQILNPNRGNLEEYRERLWNHAFAITGHKLNVVAPNGIVIRPPEEETAPQPVVYPHLNTRFRHYGSSVQKLIEKAIAMPDGPKKEGFVEVIASYMKLAYKTWNKEHFVSDDQVKEDLTLLSNGQLELHEGHSSLDTLAMGAIKMEKEMQRKQRAAKYKQINTKRKPSGPGGGSGRSLGGNPRSSGNSGAGGGINKRRRK